MSNLRDGRKKDWFYLDNALVDREDLNIYEKAAYVVLARYADNNKDTAFPAYNTIAKKIGCSRRKAIETISSLEQKKILIKTTRYKENSKENNSNLYKLLSAKIGEGSAGDAPLSAQDAPPPSAGDAPRGAHGAPKKDLNKNTYIIKNINSIFDYWNSKDIINHKKLNQKMKEEIKKALHDYSVDEIKIAIDHYYEMYKSDYQYCKYRWGLDTFLKRAEGYIKFMDDGEKWIRYCDWKKDPKKDVSNDKPVVKTKFHNFECRTSKYTAKELEDIAKNIRKKHANKGDNSEI